MAFDEKPVKPNLLHPHRTVAHAACGGGTNFAASHRLRSSAQKDATAVEAAVASSRVRSGSDMEHAHRS